MTLERTHEVNEGLSRRSLLLSLAASPLILTSCTSLASADHTSDTSSALPADQKIHRVLKYHDDIARSDPNLPGVRSLAQLNQRLTDGFSADDLSLLAGALSLKAREQVLRIRRPIAMSDVRTVLSAPIGMAPYGRPFLERTLAEARARQAVDPAYQHELQRHRHRCTCITDHTPCWICAAMGLILIIAIIAVLVL